MALPSASAGPTLVDLRQRQLRRLRELRYFKAVHNLDRAANYPESVIFHFAILASIVLAESCANMYFFAQGSDLGLLGGLFQAFLVSGTNVVVAATIGRFCLPQLQHRSNLRKTAGLIGLVAYALFAVGFNLIAGHYRDLLAKSSDANFSEAIPLMMRSPLTLSFDSIMLVAAGFVFSGIALWKGYESDDPYPGYGRVDARYRAARDAFQSARSQQPDEPYPYPLLKDDE